MQSFDNSAVQKLNKNFIIISEAIFWPIKRLCGISTVLSANTGYEKPHPEAFKTALKECGNPETVWMAGDNTEADIRGVEGFGMPAILVHREKSGNIAYYAETLTNVIGIIEK